MCVCVFKVKCFVELRNIATKIPVYLFANDSKIGRGCPGDVLIIQKSHTCLQNTSISISQKYDSTQNKFAAVKALAYQIIICFIHYSLDLFPAQKMTFFANCCSLVNRMTYMNDNLLETTLHWGQNSQNEFFHSACTLHDQFCKKTALAVHFLYFHERVVKFVSYMSVAFLFTRLDNINKTKTHTKCTYAHF